jgi:hypothetical protein
MLGKIRWELACAKRIARNEHNDVGLATPLCLPRQAGAGGQTTLIIPSHQLAIVRLGHYKGAQAGGLALRKAVSLLMEVVAPVNR